MIVCFCAASRESDIERAMEAGACSLADIGGRCRAGLDCGLCHSTLLAMLGRRACGSGPGHQSLASVVAIQAPAERSAP